MDKKAIPSWVTAAAILAVVVVIVILGVRAVSPPLPPPHVTVVSSEYGAPHPANGSARN